MTSRRDFLKMAGAAPVAAVVPAVVAGGLAIPGVGAGAVFGTTTIDMAIDGAIAMGAPTPLGIMGQMAVALCHRMERAEYMWALWGSVYRTYRKRLRRGRVPPKSAVRIWGDYQRELANPHSKLGGFRPTKQPWFTQRKRQIAALKQANLLQWHPWLKES